MIVGILNMNNYLETQINNLIEHIINNQLGFGWKNHPNRNFQGVYISGEPFDYVIFTKNKKLVFDAKQTKKDVLHLKSKDIKQIINLMKCYNSQVEAFLLIYFINDNKLMRCDVKNILNILSNRKHIKQSDCFIFDYKEIIGK
jgi:penicillin-binding protein-related factor A (putative recombinase)